MFEKENHSRTIKSLLVITIGLFLVVNTTQASETDNPYFRVSVDLHERVLFDELNSSPEVASLSLDRILRANAAIPANLQSYQTIRRQIAIVHQELLLLPLSHDEFAQLIEDTHYYLISRIDNYRHEIHVMDLTEIERNKRLQRLEVFFELLFEGI